MRKCLECGSKATKARADSYKLDPNEQYLVDVVEECFNCGKVTEFVAPAGHFTCMMAMQAWEAVRSAMTILLGVEPDLSQLPGADQS